MKSVRKIIPRFICVILILCLLHYISDCFIYQVTSTRQNAPEHLEGITANVIFSVESIRKYTGPKLRYVPASSKKELKGRQCKRWAVLTTIQAPTEAVRRQV